MKTKEYQMYQRHWAADVLIYLITATVTCRRVLKTKKNDRQENSGKKVEKCFHKNYQIFYCIFLIDKKFR